MVFLVRFGGFVGGAIGAFLLNNWLASADATAGPYGRAWVFCPGCA